MVAEPKVSVLAFQQAAAVSEILNQKFCKQTKMTFSFFQAHQTGRKRLNTAKTGNDWDYYYDR